MEGVAATGNHAAEVRRVLREGSDEVAYPRREKPPELLELYEVAATLFATLKEAFNVPETYEVSLEHVDDTVYHLQSPIDVAAFAMLKVQALRLIATPDVVTASDVVVGIAAELTRNLEELACSLDVQYRAYLRWTRDQINEAGRVVADLGQGTDEGIVELW
jgi:hypothetical protein